MKKSLVFLFAIALLPLWGEAPIPPGKMLVTRCERDRITIRSAFSKEYDLLRRGTPGWRNKQFNFNLVELIRKKDHKKEWIHNCADDTTPWNLNGTYIGANHGCSDGNTLEIKNHGFKKKDLGKKILNEKGEDFYIMEILSKDRIAVFSRPYKHPRRPWSFRRIAHKRGPLTLTIDGKKVEGKNVGIYQLAKCIHFLSIEYLADGRELKRGEKRICSRLVVKDSHIVLQPDSMVQYQIDHPGKYIDPAAPAHKKIVRNDIIYTFTPDGACIIDSSSEILADLHISLFGGLQTARACNEKFLPVHTYYVPKTLPFKAKARDGKLFHLDFVKGVDMRPYPFPKLYFSLKNKNIADPASYPDSFIQFGGFANAPGKSRILGYAMGFSMTEGLTRKGVWQEYSSRPLWIHSTRKTYPAVILNRKMKKGEKIRFFGYRQYFQPDLPGIPGSFYSHRLNDYHYYYYDSLENIPDFLLKTKLPGKMEIVEKSAFLTASQLENGVRIKSTKPYARVVFRVKLL